MIPARRITATPSELMAYLANNANATEEELSNHFNGGEIVDNPVPIRGNKHLNVKIMKRWTKDSAEKGNAEFLPFRNEIHQKTHGYNDEEKLAILWNAVDDNLQFRTRGGRVITTLEEGLKNIQAQFDDDGDATHESKFGKCQQGKLPFALWWGEVMLHFTNYVIHELGPATLMDYTDVDVLNEYLGSIRVQKRLVDHFKALADPIFALRVKSALPENPSVGILEDKARIIEDMMKAEKHALFQAPRKNPISVLQMDTQNEKEGRSGVPNRKCKYLNECFRTGCRFEHPPNHDPLQAKKNFDRKNESNKKNQPFKKTAEKSSYKDWSKKRLVNAIQSLESARIPKVQEESSDEMSSEVRCHPKNLTISENPKDSRTKVVKVGLNKTASKNKVLLKVPALKDDRTETIQNGTGISFMKKYEDIKSKLPKRQTKDTKAFNIFVNGIEIESGQTKILRLNTIVKASDDIQLAIDTINIPKIKHISVIPTIGKIGKEHELIMEISNKGNRKITLQSENPIARLTAIPMIKEINIMEYSRREKEITSPSFNLLIGRQKCMVLLDSGAMANCIDSDFLDIYLPQFNKRFPCETELLSANKSTLKMEGYAEIPITIGKRTRMERFFVIQGLSKTMIMGYPTFTEWEGILNSTKNQIEFGKYSVKMISNISESLVSKWEIHSLNNEIILPKTEQLILATIPKKGRLVIPDKQVVMVEPIRNAKEKQYRGDTAYGITEVNIKENDKSTIKISMANVSDDIIKIKKNQLIGNITLITPKTMGEAQIINFVGEATAEKNSKKDVNQEWMERLLKEISISEQLDIIQRREVENLVLEYEEIFTDKTQLMTHVQEDELTHFIDTGNSPPVSTAPRRTSPQQKEDIEKEIESMLKHKIIQPSNSPWSSAILLVPKPDGTWRFCVDYRRLNDVTVKDVYPLPRIDETIDALVDSNYMSVFDLTSGYWQIPVDKTSLQKTAFISHKGLFEFTKMPFGLTNAPATFQRFVDGVLAGLKWQCCLVYIDDIIIYSRTFDQHLKDMRLVFDRLKGKGLKLKPNKCKLCCNEVKFLGHQITTNGIRLNPEKVEALTKVEFSETEDFDKLEHFLGLTGYYRRFVPDYAQKTVALRELLHVGRKNKKSQEHWKWNPEHQMEFDKLKELLTTEGGPILSLPSYEGEFRFAIHTDASDKGVGAILYQKQKGIWKVLQYASRTLTKPELKWHTTEKEALAILWACELFRPYVIGREFDVITDHASLEWLKKSEKGRLARWAMTLGEYNPVIQHKAGKLNSVPDFLSRFPTKEATEADMLKELPQFISAIAFNPEEKSFTAINAIESTNIIEDKGYRLTDKNLWEMESFKEELITRYSDDEWTRTIKEVLSKEESKRTEKEKTRNRFYHIGQNGFMVKKTIVENEKTRTALLIPHPMRFKVMELFHNGELMGHLGRNKTYFKMLRYVWWPGMFRDLKNFIRTCKECQFHKSINNSKNRELFSSTPQQIWEKAHIDLVGPLPLTNSNMRYLCVMTDSFSKWAEIIPIPSKEADIVATAIFNHLLCRHGLPLKIYTDQGTEFQNRLMQRLSERIGFKLEKGNPYYPQANGQVERLNKTIIESLSAVVEEFTKEEPADWDKYIPGIQFAYNTARHEVLGMTPFEIIHGRSSRLPFALLTQYARVENIGDDAMYEDVANFKTRITYNLIRAHQMVAKTLKNTAAKRNAQWNAHARPLQLKVGDFILLKKTPNDLRQRKDYKYNSGESINTRKLDSEFLGPYSVKSTRRNTVTIWNHDKEIEQTVALANVKQFKIRNEVDLAMLHEMNQENTVSESTNETVTLDKNLTSSFHDLREYECEIMDHARKGKAFKYLVKWIGYPFDPLTHRENQENWIHKDQMKNRLGLTVYWTRVANTLPLDQIPKEFQKLQTRPFIERVVKKAEANTTIRRSKRLRVQFE